MTTVSTIVRILEEKGFVDHDAFGRSHRYHARVSKATYGDRLARSHAPHAPGLRGDDQGKPKEQPYPEHITQPSGFSREQVMRSSQCLAARSGWPTSRLTSVSSGTPWSRCAR